MNVFARTRRFYRENGARALPRKAAAYLHGRFIVPMKPDPIGKHRLKLGRALLKKSGGAVLQGPLAGFRLNPSPNWGAGDLGPMLLGTYEKPILDKLVELSRSAGLLVDIGAAHGYFGIGLVASGYFEKSACFELDSDMRDTLRSVAMRNGVADDVLIFGPADAGLAAQLNEAGVALSDAVVLCDVEGAEFDILTPELLETLKSCAIVVELHEKNVEDGERRLARLLEDAELHFTTSFLDYGAREVPNHEFVRHLPETERWMLVSEGRNMDQRWLILLPRDR